MVTDRIRAERLREPDIYRDELLKLGHGYPVFEPDPKGEYDKVKIGDVGYVDSYGCFHPVFNAFLPPEHPINQRNGTPEGYTPLDSRFSSTFSRCDLPAGAMYSTHVRVLGCNFGASGSCVPANATIKLSVSNHCGAALVIKRPAFRQDSHCMNHLSNYMLRNYRSWLTFIHDDLGRSVKLHDIVLVTGCDLTAEWATATFVEKSSNCEVEFKAGDPTMLASGFASVWGTWQSSIHVPSRCGPSPIHRTSMLDTLRDVDTPQSQSRDSERDFYNQCIFLRGFRVKERRLLSPRIIEAAAEPNDLDMDRDGDMAPIIFSLEDGFDSNEDENDELNVTTDWGGLPDSAKSLHDTLLDLILDNTEADVALIHDSDVAKRSSQESFDVKSTQYYESIVIDSDTSSGLKVGYFIPQTEKGTIGSPEELKRSPNDVMNQYPLPVLYSSTSPSERSLPLLEMLDSPKYLEFEKADSEANGILAAKTLWTDGSATSLHSYPPPAPFSTNRSLPRPYLYQQMGYTHSQTEAETQAAIRKLSEARLHERAPKACKQCSQKHRKCLFKLNQSKCDLCAKNNRDCEILPLSVSYSRKLDYRGSSVSPQPTQIDRMYTMPTSPTYDRREPPHPSASSSSSYTDPRSLRGHMSVPYDYPGYQKGMPETFGKHL